ncbi:MAG: nucleotidyltransferase domain-containing protein [Paludibacteraceae bacterium]
MKYGISDMAYSRIQDALQSVPAIKRAIIYGSRARGDFRNGADIDLTLDGDGLQKTDLYRLYHLLDDLLLPYRFDLSIHDEIRNQALLHNIQRDGQVFYSIQ